LNKEKNGEFHIKIFIHYMDRNIQDCFKSGDTMGLMLKPIYMFAFKSMVQFIF